MESRGFEVTVWDVGRSTLLVKSNLVFNVCKNSYPTVRGIWREVMLNKGPLASYIVHTPKSFYLFLFILLSTWFEMLRYNTFELLLFSEIKHPINSWPPLQISIQNFLFQKKLTIWNFWNHRSVKEHERDLKRSNKASSRRETPKNV
jgi:hypothetical protein